MEPQRDSTRRSGRTRPVGVGLGLRWEFLEEVLDGPHYDIGFFEVSPENYLERGGYYPDALRRIAEDYPIVTHGLTLSLGAVDEPNPGYLAALKREIAELRSPWHSDHLCFASAGSRVLHELLPLTFSQENVERVALRARRVQDVLGVPLAIENISYYVHPGQAEMSEQEFLQRVLAQSGVGLLLDVNNVYVNSQNHGFDPQALIAALPLERVLEVHVAGHSRQSDGMLLDTHGAPVADPVLALLEWTLGRTGPVPVLLERDNHVPAFDELLAELALLSQIHQRSAQRWESLRATSA